VGQGFKVIRSAGSHGPIDLMAARQDYGILAIQVKRGKNLDGSNWQDFMSLDELRKLRAWAETFYAVPVLTYKSDATSKWYHFVLNGRAHKIDLFDIPLATAESEDAKTTTVDSPHTKFMRSARQRQT